MTRHRSPRGRGASTVDAAARPHTAPTTDARHATPPAGLPAGWWTPTGGLHQTGPLRTGPHRTGARSGPLAGPRTGPPTGPLGGGARHRSPARSELRHGAVAAGLTGSALAAVAPATMQLPAQDAGADLALSSQAVSASPVTAGRPTVAPVSRGEAVGAASADLIKASDRGKKQAAAAQQQATAKAAAAAAAAKAAAPKPAPAAKSTSCGVSDSYGGVQDGVQAVGNAMECVFPGHDVLGVGSRGNASDHPGGRALDFMTRNTADGNRIAECVVDNADALGVSYVIWNQRINTGGGWEGMEDRGGATANHEDHVHISFSGSGSPQTSALGRCR